MLRRRLLAASAAVLAAACGSTGSSAVGSPARTSAPISGGTTTKTPDPSPTTAHTAGSTATVELAKGGSFSFTLRADKAPKTVANFVAKARAGFYDGLTFHRVVPGFVVQGGDPLGTGSGGGTQPTELSDLPFETGAIGIARGGDIKVSNDAQFFIVTASAPHLNGQYTNFGQLTQGMDVVLAIKVGDKMKTVTIN
ncbi:MAG: peptidylprolyl isomerase [Chloroflexota bacterium]|nr:peptidylprolyl isomerase [Chloroflexota bacterium]